MAKIRREGGATHESLPAGQADELRVLPSVEEPGREQAFTEMIDAELAAGIQEEFTRQTDPLIYGDGTGEPRGVLGALGGTITSYAGGEPDVPTITVTGSISSALDLTGEEFQSPDDDMPPDYASWTVEELKAELHRRDLPKTGNKDMLVGRLKANEPEDED